MWHHWKISHSVEHQRRPIGSTSVFRYPVKSTQWPSKPFVYLSFDTQYPLPARIITKQLSELFFAPLQAIFQRLASFNPSPIGFACFLLFSRAHASYVYARPWVQPPTTARVLAKNAFFPALASMCSKFYAGIVAPKMHACQDTKIPPWAVCKTCIQNTQYARAL